MWLKTEARFCSDELSEMGSKDGETDLGCFESLLHFGSLRRLDLDAVGHF